MNIGIWVRSLVPPGPAEERLQTSIFSSLRRFNTGKYRFFVFCPEVPPGFKSDEQIAYVALARDSWSTRIARFLKGRASAILQFACRLLGLSGRAFYAKLAQWPTYEPPYFPQLRELNIRLMWNMNEAEIHSFLPFIKVIWDINFRINSMFPEYSFTRFGFEVAERNASSLHRASYVVVGTEEGKRQLIDIFGVHKDKIRVIPFPTPDLRIDNQASVQAAVNPVGGRYIFYPARFWPHKNHVVIVEALKVLRDKWGIVLPCVFCGDDKGNMGYIERYAENLGVREQIEFLGFVPVKELAALYRKALTLVYASAVGPDNLPPLEAMSLDCPVITADVTGARGQLGDAALFFSPTNENELAERIKQVLDDAILRQQLIERGRQRAACWTPDDYVKSVLSIIDEFALIARAWERCDSVFT
jgi:glycosyltransferase involved in cell wall biosynthesis